MTTKHSIRNQLLLWIGAAFLITILVAIHTGFLSATHEIDEIYDVRLINSAKAIAQVMNLDSFDASASTFILDKSNHKSGTDEDSDYESKLGFRIWIDKQLIAQSPSTFSFFGFRAAKGFSNRQIGEWNWRLYVLEIPRRHLTIEISERSDIRGELTTRLLAALIGPWGIFVPAIGLIIWFGVRKSLAPVIDISNDVDARESKELSPIDLSGVPDEISPLIRALNRLFKRTEDSMRREREFTDHAAHELRTPLAAMKTQTQVLMRKARQFPEYKAGLENLHATIDRSAHLVDQLLSLAQIQSESSAPTRINLTQCIYSAINDVATIASWKNIAMTFRIAEDIHIEGHPVPITILLKNLIDNAVKYTPANGQVLISLATNGLFHVVDTGPGLPDEDKAKVFDRFVRVDRTGQTGSGLGLAMVQQIALAHGVEVRLYDNKPNGLAVEIRWNIINLENRSIGF